MKTRTLPSLVSSALTLAITMFVLSMANPVSALCQDLEVHRNNCAVSEAAQRQDFIALAEDASATLAKRASIPAEEIVAWHLLEDLRIFPRGATEVLTAPVVELGRAIIELVSGELPEEPKGKTWFYGTPTGRQTLGGTKS